MFEEWPEEIKKLREAGIVLVLIMLNKEFGYLPNNDKPGDGVLFHILNDMFYWKPLRQVFSSLSVSAF